jgi:hypothetical protein
VGLVLFRKVIRQKIGELRSISKGDAKAYFDATVGSADANARAAERTIATTPGRTRRIRLTEEYAESVSQPGAAADSGQTVLGAPAPVQLDEDAVWMPVENLVEVSPQHAIYEAGKRIDEAVSRLAEPYGSPPSTLIAARVLGEAGTIPAELVPAINGLVTLRNQVVQSADFPVSKDEARNFIAAARKVCGVLNQIPRLQAR